MLAKPGVKDSCARTVRAKIWAYPVPPLILPTDVVIRYIGYGGPVGSDGGPLGPLGPLGSPWAPLGPPWAPWAPLGPWGPKSIAMGRG